MKIINNHKMVYSTILFSLGVGYFSFFSSLELPIFFRGYIPIIPIQLFCLIYIFLFLDKSNRKK